MIPNEIDFALICWESGLHTLTHTQPQRDHNSAAVSKRNFNLAPTDREGKTPNGHYICRKSERGMGPKQGARMAARVGWGGGFKRSASVWPWLEGVQSIAAHLLTAQPTSLPSHQPHERDRLPPVKLIIVLLSHRCSLNRRLAWSDTHAHTRSDNQTAGLWQHATISLFG